MTQLGFNPRQDRTAKNASLSGRGTALRGETVKRTKPKLHRKKLLNVKDIARTMSIEGFVVTSMRLPPNLHEALSKEAAAAGMSLNAFMVSKLQDSIPNVKKAS